MVVSLKDFADTADTMMIPLLKEALDAGNVSDVAEVIHELVDSYKAVHAQLSHLKDEHNNITSSARALSDQAARKSQEALAVSKIENAKADVGGYTAVGGLVTATGTGIGIVCLGACGPVGWMMLGASAAAVGGGLAKAVGHECTRDAQKLLMRCAETINNQMLRVTTQLESQCAALEMLVSQIQNCSNSAEKIQGLVDAWNEDAASISNMKKRWINLWLDEKFPLEMRTLSGYCTAYLGEEVTHRKRMIEAMQLSIE